MITGQLIGTIAPLFVNYTGGGSGDYHLSATSPAIARGTTVGAPSIASCRIRHPLCRK